MSDFDEFASLYTRFRLAAQYNGHLWHHLADRTRGITDKHRHALLRVLRSRLCEDEHAHRTIEELLDELVDQVEHYRPSAPGGMTTNVVPCPWWPVGERSARGKGSAEGGCKGPSITDTAADCRKGFCGGIDALKSLLKMIGAVGIARTQVFRYSRRNPDARLDLRDADGIARRILISPLFVEGCLSRITMSHWDLGLLALVSGCDNPARMKATAIKRMVWNPIVVGKDKPWRLSGRLASIANNVLDRKYGRPSRKKKEPDQPEPVRELTGYTFDVPVQDYRPKLLEFCESAEAAVRKSPPEHHAALRFFLRKARENDVRRGLYKEMAAKFGISPRRASKIVAAYRRRLLSEVKP